MSYTVYRVLITIFFFLVLLPVLPLILLFGSKYRYKFRQRLAEYPLIIPPADPNRKVVWIHAASVGEMQAAKALIQELSDRDIEVEFVVTTMTSQGHRVAQSQLPDSTRCLLAPLDVPFIVRRALEKIGPDIYICLETELWPVMLHAAKKNNVKMLLLNGRMSEKSFLRYSKFKDLMEELLSGFSAIGVISEKDGQHYRELGFKGSDIQVTGNIKYDLQVEDKDFTRNKYRAILGLGTETIFICGSTRSGEEEILCRVFLRLQQEAPKPLVWIVAPRHLKRLEEVVSLFKQLGLAFDFYSDIKHRGRSHSIVLVDCMGELAELYSVGDFNFCGGSLVDKGGHNIMEAAQFGRPVYFGPSMKDFHDAVEILKPAGAGFQVDNENALTELLLGHMHSKYIYDNACRAAARMVAQHRGAARRQADMVTQLLAA